MAASAAASAISARCGCIIFRRVSSPRVFSKPLGNNVCCFQRFMTLSAPRLKGDTVSITLITNRETKEVTLTGRENSTVLELLKDNDINFDGFAACDGGLACSSCHVVFTEDDFKKITEEPCNEENDLLDMARGLTDTSRLGCQVKITKELNGIKIKMGPDDNLDMWQIAEAKPQV